MDAIRFPESITARHAFFFCIFLSDVRENVACCELNFAFSCQESERPPIENTFGGMRASRYGSSTAPVGGGLDVKAVNSSALESG